MNSDKSAPDRSRDATQRLLALGDMTGGIAHDLRNLFAVIETGARLANEHADQPEKVRSYISVTRDAIVRGVDLTSRPLGFAQQKFPDRKDEDVNELLRNLEPFLRYAAGPGIRVILDLQERGKHSALNRTQFEVAILNLVTNARDAMPEGGQISIQTDTCTVGTKVNSGKSLMRRVFSHRVKDSGQGIPAEVIRKRSYLHNEGRKRNPQIGLPQVYAFTKRAGELLSAQRTGSWNTIRAPRCSSTLIGVPMTDSPDQGVSKKANCIDTPDDYCYLW